MVDFLGIENQNLKELALTFPDARIISRGNALKIIASDAEILKIQELINSILSHIKKYGEINFKII